MVYIFHSLSCVWFMLFVYFQTINNDTTKYNCIAMQISKELQNLCLVHAIKCSYFGPWAVSWAFLWGFWSVCRRQCFWSPRRRFGAWHSCSGRKKHGWMCSSWCLRRGQQGGHWGHSKTSSGDFVIALLDVLYPFFLRTFLENFIYLHHIYIFTPSLPFDSPHVLSTSWQLSWTLLLQLFLHTNTPVEFVECCFSVYTLLEPNTWYWITYQVTHPLRRLNLPLSAVINSL